MAYIREVVETLCKMPCNDYISNENFKCILNEVLILLQYLNQMTELHKDLKATAELDILLSHVKSNCWMLDSTLSERNKTLFTLADSHVAENLLVSSRSNIYFYE